MKKLLLFISVASALATAAPALAGPGRLRVWYGSRYGWIYPGDPCWDFALGFGPGAILLSQCPYWGPYYYPAWYAWWGPLYGGRYWWRGGWRPNHWRGDRGNQWRRGDNRGRNVAAGRAGTRTSGARTSGARMSGARPAGGRVSGGGARFSGGGGGRMGGGGHGGGHGGGGHR